MRNVYVDTETADSSVLRNDDAARDPDRAAIWDRKVFRPGGTDVDGALPGKLQSTADRSGGIDFAVAKPRAPGPLCQA